MGCKSTHFIYNKALKNADYDYIFPATKNNITIFATILRSFYE